MALRLISRSPATNSSCHRHRRIKGFVAPGRARKNLRRLDTSNGCQDHAVLPYAAARLCQKASPGFGAVVLCKRYRSRNKPALHYQPHTDAAASTTSRPNVRDDGQRPSPWGRDGEAYSSDLPDALSGIFFWRGLDRANHVESAREIAVLAQRSWCPFDGHLVLIRPSRSSKRTES
jgi:hypothetical protein